jgi:hypothetical protein
LEAAIEHALKNPEKYVVGEQCRFCDAKGICPEYNKEEQEEIAEIDPRLLSSLPMN